MKVTIQQKILGGVVLLGAAALAADRMFFLPRENAQVQSAPAAAEYALPATSKPAASVAPQPPIVSVARRLRDAAGSNADALAPDAFVFGPEWKTNKPAEHALEKSVDPALAAGQYRLTHHLTGVLSSNGRAVAMIDGKIVAVGQEVDGYRLIEISHRSATFECNQTQVTLNMTERSAPTVASVGQ